MARPTKWTDEQWAKARALYEAGKSLRSIDKETGINYKSVENRVKNEGWKQGILSQQIADQLRVETGFSTLLPSQQDVVKNEVNERLADLSFIRRLTNKNLSVLEDKITKDLSVTEHLIVQNTVAKGRESYTGKEVAPVVNNLQFNTNVKFTKEEALERLTKANEYRSIIESARTVE